MTDKFSLSCPKCGHILMVTAVGVEQTSSKTIPVTNTKFAAMKSLILDSLKSGDLLAPEIGQIVAKTYPDSVRKKDGKMTLHSWILNNLRQEGKVHRQAAINPMTGNLTFKYALVISERKPE